jgi:DNA-directed RNA polymerase subunit RPC12/RpoP
MKCGQCGGKLRRVHRTFWERFSYMAIYECRKCEREEFAPRRYRYHLGQNTRCPVCGSFRVVKLKHPDRIDRMHTGFLNFLERISGKGKLFHCRWCRLQFYDRRELAELHRVTDTVHAGTGAAGPPEPSADAPDAAEPTPSGPAS